MISEHEWGYTVGELIDILNSLVVGNKISKDTYFSMPSNDNSDRLTRVRGLGSVSYSGPNMGKANGGNSVVWIDPIRWS